MVEGSGGVLGLAPDVRRWPERAAYAACIWALVFAAAHDYWASGGTVLLGEAAASCSSSRDSSRSRWCGQARKGSAGALCKPVSFPWRTRG